MGHLLAGQNPQAVERLARHNELPGVGMSVLYYPRVHEVRRGRECVPAIVLAVDEQNRQLDLICFLDNDDFIGQTGVPEHVENDRGWALLPSPALDVQKDIADLRADLAALRAMILPADMEKPDEPVLELIDILTGRIEDIEKLANTPAPVPPIAKETPAKPRRRARNVRKSA